jgi:hypothetical protein
MEDEQRVFSVAVMRATSNLIVSFAGTQPGRRSSQVSLSGRNGMHVFERLRRENLMQVAGPAANHTLPCYRTAE